MQVMKIGENNWEKEMATMNSMLQKLAKESKEKEASIKLYKEKIAKLTRKLKKQPT